MKLLETDLLENNIIELVEAQSSDALAQPTFVTDIDFSDTTTGGTGGDTDGGTDGDTDGGTDGDTDGDTGTSGGEGGVISLDTNAADLGLDENFTLAIVVDSGESDLASYSIKLEFDPTILQVLDSDGDATGTQIAAEDNGFSVTENEVSNSNGTIFLRAESSSEVSVSDVVASVNFVVIREGIVDITVVEAESSLVDDSSNNVLGTADALKITISGGVGEVAEVVDDSSVPVEGVKELPESDLPFSGVIYMLVGLVLIYIGYIGRKIYLRENQES